jgi:hypothetical protein
VGLIGCQQTFGACNAQQEKHCMQLKPGHFTAEAKGKDRVAVYAWTNPMFKGDLSKATKVTYFISNRTH